jgi:hypothetical protein
MFFGFSGNVGIVNYYKSGSATLDDFKIQYDSSTKLRLRPEGVNIITSASQTPVNNLDLCFEATSNTTLTAKLKGSDGTVRGFNLPLETSPVDHRITISTSAPSGGVDGDVWYQVV